MSAIAGIVFFNGASVAPGTVERMTAAMAGRGPDGIGHWQSDTAAFGHCLLCTTPESRREVQPLMNDDGSAVLVFAGRIDNRKELRSALLGSGAVLRNDTDAELVLRAWELWGEQSPLRLIGDFVYFVWNTRTRQLFGARDTTGVRHFYYQTDGQWFAFASEAAALHTLGLLQQRLNHYRVFDYTAAVYDRIDGSETFWLDTHRLPHAHALTVSSSGLRSWRYWHPEHLPTLRFASMQDCQQAFLEVFKQAIACRLRSTGAVGATLSGGLDSSSIVAVIGKYLRDELTQPLQTYSLVRAERDQCLDWRYIKPMLAEGQLESIVIDTALTDEQCRRLLAGIPSLDQPYALAEALPSMLIAEAARSRGCRVMLEGMAADLFFYSPQDSLEQVFRQRQWSALPSVLAAHRRHHIEGAGAALLRKLVRELLPERARQYYRQRQQALTDEDQALLTLLPADAAVAYIANRSAMRQARETDCRNGHQSQQLIADLLGPMLAFAYEQEDAGYGAAHAELRGPYADRRLMEFMYAMPPQARLARGWFKSFLRESMAGILPDFVRLRRERSGHPGWEMYQRIAHYTAAHDLKTWLRPGQDAIFDALVDKTVLQRLYKEEQELGLPRLTQDLFRLVVLHRWLHTIKS